VNQIKRKSRFRAWELAAAALILGLLGFVLLRGHADPAPAAANPSQVLLVVGRLPIEAGDARVKERLEMLGWRVTTRTAALVQSSDARGRVLVLISSTSLARDVLEAPAELTAKFRDAAVAVVTWEPRLFYDLGMIGGSVYHKDWGAAKDQTRLVVTNPRHPLAAGFDGRVVVTSGPDHLSWGRARADAIKIATIEGDPERSALFAYDRGSRMPGLVAPGRRVGLFLFDATSLQLTPQGWALFDAAVRWCVQP
jgi:hypothetical protein